MRIVIPRDDAAAEKRVPIVPESVKRLIAKKIDVSIEAGAGLRARVGVDELKAAGAAVETSRDAPLRERRRDRARPDPDRGRDRRDEGGGGAHLAPLPAPPAGPRPRARGPEDDVDLPRPHPAHDRGADDGRALLSGDDRRLLPPCSWRPTSSRASSRCS